jgi:hypothetical protein
VNTGDTFLVAADVHLWFVVSDPTVDPDRVVCMMFTTLRERCDEACVVRAGEHPFVRHDTVVQYSAARIVSLAKFLDLSRRQIIRASDPLSPELPAKIRRSAEGSDRIPNDAYAILREQGSS